MARTLRDFLVEQSINGYSPIMDDVEKKSGILITMPLIAANHNKYHLYMKSGTLPSGTIRLIGGSVTPSAVNNTLGQADLFNFAILQQDDEDLVYNLGGGRSEAAVIAYFNARYAQYLEGMIQTISTQLIYGTNSTFGNDQGWAGLHQYAKASSLVTQLAGTTGSRTSIFFVRWNPNFCAGVVNSAVMDGSVPFMTSTTPERIKKVTNTTTGAQQPVWSVDHNSQMGLMVSSDVCVSAITQLDSTHIMTSTQVITALRQIHSLRDLENTYVYCNEVGYGYLNSLKEAKFQTTPENKDYNTMLEFFDRAKIVVDENILSTETTVLD